MRYPAQLAPLLLGVAVRQALSRTAQVQASLSRPGGNAARPHPTWLAALTAAADAPPAHGSFWAPV